MHQSSLAMQMLLNHISFQQQSDINRVISIEWYQQCDIHRLTSTYWNKQSEMNRVTLTQCHHQRITLKCLPLSHKHTDTQSHKHTHTNTQIWHYNQLTVGIWQVLRLQVDGTGKKVWVICFILFALSPHTVSMTLSPSLLANGHQLGCPEHVISHCPQ